MGKRTVSSFAVFCVVLFSLIMRLYLLADSGIASASQQNSTKTITVGTSRGMIYDRTMAPLVGAAGYDLACVLPTARALTALKETLSDEEFAAQSEKLKNGSLVTFKTAAGEALKQCQDIAVLKIYDRYGADKLAPHVIGYLGADAAGAFGAEKCYNTFLSENGGSLTLAYSADALGRVLGGVEAEVRNNNYASKAGIKLTLDATIQKITEDALKNAGFITGAAVVLNVNNGKVLALASFPAFDPNNVAAALKDTNAPFVNRALTNYSVGSVFKIVAAAAALESGVSPDYAYCCTGSCVQSGTRFYCHNRDGHGTLTMKEAFAVSCNTYFINLALQLDRNVLLQTAETLGFSRSLSLMDGYASDKAILPDLSALDSDAAVANFAFGQGTLLATPVHLAACYLVAADGGTYYEPTLFEGTADESGAMSSYASPSLPKKALSSDVCKTLREFLLETVETGSGKAAKSENYLCGGKTATAQTGRYTADGTELMNTWFVGFYPYEKPQYVIAIIKENGASGGADGAPVFKDICEKLFSLKNPN